MPGARCSVWRRATRDVISERPELRSWSLTMARSKRPAADGCSTRRLGGRLVRWLRIWRPITVPNSSAGPDPVGYNIIFRGQWIGSLRFGFCVRLPRQSASAFGPSEVTAVSEVARAGGAMRARLTSPATPGQGNHGERESVSAASRRLIAGSRSSLVLTTRWRLAGSSVIETKSRLWLA